MNDDFPVGQLVRLSDKHGYLAPWARVLIGMIMIAENSKIVGPVGVIWFNYTHSFLYYYNCIDVSPLASK